ncbi:MAG: hypothetical protein IPM51_12280 [Sphingobacteriaceae bacterium]|nr:hypothetical protein [Sphingobacteriaceae bacterium]
MYDFEDEFDVIKNTKKIIHIVNATGYNKKTLQDRLNDPLYRSPNEEIKFFTYLMQRTAFCIDKQIAKYLRAMKQDDLLKNAHDSVLLYSLLIEVDPRAFYAKNDVYELIKRSVEFWKREKESRMLGGPPVYNDIEMFKIALMSNLMDIYKVEENPSKRAVRDMLDDTKY